MDEDPKKKSEDHAQETPLQAGAPQADDTKARVVYRRQEPADANEPTDTAKSVGVWTQQLAPAIMPLIIGFLILLILISVLGIVTTQRMDEVGGAVLGLEQQHAAKFSLLLKLRLALTKLNNEARARAEADARGGLKPPLDMPLINARQEAHQLLSELERPPLSNDETWRQFRVHLQEYVEVAEDLRRYSLEGFDKFRVVDAELNTMLAQSGQH